ncbi:MAG TPA: response regulator [Sporichthyaceae bacterium]|jgi:two-component system KDP operon response regulator KdpE|nr:response regulator [Sporichthyaceae bacterium]
MTRILVVDDDPQILQTLQINLRARKYDVTAAATGTAALEQAEGWRPDLVLLDLGLPDIDGVDVIHGLRGWTAVPIVVLSGRAGSRDKVAALDAGADDYVTKPFGVDELLARIRAATRRHAGDEGTGRTVRIGRYTVDLGDKAVHGTQPDVADLRLTPIEWQLVEILVRHPGKLITQHQLLEQIWGPSFTSHTHYLRQYMAQLRHKLEPDPTHPRHLLTELGMGYRFAA